MSPPHAPPCFSIILIDHSAPHVEIPRDFIRKHLRNKIPKDPMIQSVNGGYSWKLKIKKIGEKYCFSHGWNNVINDINLGFGDFLYFRLVDQSTFKMSVYGLNACEKTLPPKIEIDVEDDNDDEDDIVDVNDDVIVYEDEDDDMEDVDDDVEDEDADVEDDEDEFDDHVDDGDDDVDDDEEDDMDCDIDGHDGDPFFTKTFTRTDINLMRLKAVFLGLAGIDDERPITIKNSDGEEWPMELRFENMYKRYHLTSGWSTFVRDNHLSIGDKCVFKFITSEDKLCLVKVTKNRSAKRQPRPPQRRKITTKEVTIEHRGGGDNMEREEEDDMDDNVNVDADDNDDDDDNEEDEDDSHGDIDGDDGDPFFTKTFTRTDINVLRLKSVFPGLAGIDVERPITIKNSDGKEWPMELRLENLTRRYHLTSGWCTFVRDNHLSVGDKCVFKFITSEDKLCLVKVTKNKRAKRHPRPPQRRKITTKDRGGDDLEGKDEDDDNVDDDDDDDDDDDNDDVVVVDDDDDTDNDDNEEEDIDGDIDGHDGDPFFTKTFTRTDLNVLRLKSVFLGLAQIDDERPITVKNRDGEEWPVELRLEKLYQRYRLTSGWSTFVRNNDLSVGDKCVFKFITSEDKLCLVKVTKNRSAKQQPQTPPRRKITTRGVPIEHRGGDDSEGEGANVVKRSRGRPPKNRRGSPAQ